MTQIEGIDIDTQAERAVIGAMLADHACLVEGAALLGPDDFGSAQNRAAFEAMGGLVRRGVSVDVLTLADELRDWHISTVDLTAMAMETPVFANLKHYAEMVARAAGIRRLRALCGELPSRAYDNAAEAQRLVLEAQRLVTQVARGRAKPGVDVADLVHPLLDEFQARVVARDAQSGRLSGMSTGITALDFLTGGYRRGTLNIVAARTSIGKTAYACQVALLGAVHAGIPALFFSLEMRPEELGERFFARLGKVESDRLRSGDLHEEDWRCLNAVGSQMSRRGMVTISNARTISAIATEARAFRVQNPDRNIAVVVDYLQIVRSGERGRTREQEVASVSGALKELSVELDCPVIAPAQLNRRSEAEGDDPKTSDIRESGAIENDADMILFIIRERKDASGLCRIVVEKNRNGQVGPVSARWKGATYTLEDTNERVEHWTS